MAKKFNYLISYDISSNIIRRRVADCLERVGSRVQKSVFILELAQHEIYKVKKSLKEIIDNDENHHIMIIVLCQSCQSKSMHLGKDHEKYVIF
jgi:CRISPR-associated endonuclease Cas2